MTEPRPTWDSTSTCPLCSGTDTPAFVRLKDTEIFYLICQDCGLIFHTTPIPEDYYKAEYRVSTHGTEEVNDRVLREQSLRAFSLLPFLNPFITKGTTVLDVGSSTGKLLEVLRDRGAEVTGVEPSTAYASYQRERGITVYPNLASVRVERRFDIITCIHTLEHFTDPNRELSAMRMAAHDKTLLLVEVPHPFYEPSALRLSHPCLYTEMSLEVALYRNGWYSVWVLPWQGVRWRPLPPNVLSMANICGSEWYAKKINEYYLSLQIQAGKGKTGNAESNQA